MPVQKILGIRAEKMCTNDFIVSARRIATHGRKFSVLGSQFSVLRRNPRRRYRVSAALLSGKMVVRLPQKRVP